MFAFDGARARVQLPTRILRLTLVTRSSTAPYRRPQDTIGRRDGRQAPGGSQTARRQEVVEQLVDHHEKHEVAKL